jgi:hypothetical protein
MPSPNQQAAAHATNTYHHALNMQTKRNNTKEKIIGSSHIKTETTMWGPEHPEGSKPTLSSI